jgi:hypothetical protein
MNSIAKVASFVNEFGEGGVFKAIRKFCEIDLLAPKNLSIAG